MLLALWMPATSLCLIERAGWFANDDCCPSSSKDAPDGKPAPEKNCCALASATYKANDDQTLTVSAPLLAFLILPDLIALVEASDAFQSLPVTHSPTDLSVSWQFSSRAAAPPRAPSLVS
jgi:hypothetical protein